MCGQALARSWALCLSQWPAACRTRSLLGRVGVSMEALAGSEHQQRHQHGHPSSLLRFKYLS